MLVIPVVDGASLQGFAVNSLDPSGSWTALQRMAVCSVVAVYIFCAATGLGLRLLKVARIRADSPWERLVISAGVGFGLISLLALGLGLAGILSPVFWAVLLGIFILGSIGELLRLWGELGSDFSVLRPKTGFEYWLAAIVLLVFAANFLAAFAPPLDYDELEYHLAAPAQYLGAGRVFFIADNVYANFPENCEMLYLISMVLSGGTIAGAYTSKLVNVLLGVLAAVTVWRVGIGLFSRRVGAIAGAILYSAPWVAVVTQKAYVEASVLFYVTLVLLAAARYWCAGRGRRRWEEVVLVGVFCGLAAGTKYPAVLFVAVPAVVFIILANLPEPRRLVKHGVICVLFMVAAFGPWLFKNFAYTGNPTYPLLYRVFDGRNWDEFRDARFKRAHSPGEVSGGEFSGAAGEYFFAGGLASPALAVFLPFCLLYAGYARRRAALMLYGVFVFLSWFLLTHRIPRFLVPMLPALALLAACGAEVELTRWWRKLCHIVVVGLVGYCALVVLRIDFQGLALHRVALGMESPRAYIGRLTTGSNYSQDAIDFVNRIPASENVLFLGEAQSFYATRPIIAPTVFDAKLVDQIEDPGPSGREFWKLLRASSIDYVYVNYDELKRLQETYSFEHGGRWHLGYSDWLGEDAASSVRLLSSMHGKYLVPVAAFPAAEGQAVFPFVIYRVLEAVGAPP